MAKGSMKLQADTTRRYTREIYDILKLDPKTAEGRREYRRQYEAIKAKTIAFNKATGSTYSPLAAFHAIVKFPAEHLTDTVKAIQKTSTYRGGSAKNRGIAIKYLAGEIVGPGDNHTFHFAGGRFSGLLNTSQAPGMVGEAFKYYQQYVDGKITADEFKRLLEDIATKVKEAKDAQPVEGYY